MKKQICLIVLLLILASCSTNAVEPENKIIKNGNKIIYQEIETQLTEDMIYAKDIGEEKERLKKKGYVLKHVNKNRIAYRQEMKRLKGKVECAIGKSDCKIIGILAYKNNLPNEYTIEYCNEDDWCEVIEPKLPKQVVLKIELGWQEFYAGSKDVYTVGRTDKEKGIYTIFKNEKEIFSAEMEYGSDGPIKKASMLFDQPFFEYIGVHWAEKEKWFDNNCLEKGDKIAECQSKHADDKNINLLCQKEQDADNDCNQIWDKREYFTNIYFDGGTINSEYGVDGSKNIFIYKEKLGFVVEKNNQFSVFLQDQKISEDFDEIRTNSCCMIFAYPFEIYEDGTLFFMARRGEKLFFVEIDLDNYS